MEKLMASSNVADKLSHLEAKISVHESLHRQNTETLREVKDVLVSNARIGERINHIDSKLDAADARFEKLETRVQANHNKIIYWSGALFSILSIAGYLLK